MRRVETLHTVEQALQVIRSLWVEIKTALQTGERLAVEVRHSTRSLEQNKRMWAMLTDISEQVQWYGKKLQPDEWKDVFTAALKRQEVVPGIDGGFVVLGSRTSKMTVKEMTDLMELISAFGAERGVEFDE